MKVVINSCFGGFGLSVEAIKKLTLLNAKCIKSIKPKEYYSGNKPAKRENWEEKWKQDYEEYYDIGDGFKAHKYGYNIYNEDKNLLYDFESYDDKNENRTDQDLIKVVEELGEKSWGSCAELKIIEIPDGINWGIDNYDGMESVEEAHQSWS